MILSKDGISVDLPVGWEGRAFVPSVPPPALNFPVLHASSFAMVPDDSSFAGRLAAAMSERDAMFSLVEYDPRLAGDALFREHRLPMRVSPAEVHPTAMQVPRRGQGGAQRFFAASSRAFCLYVIVGNERARFGELDAILASLRIEPIARLLPPAGVDP
ncbi:MAG TPA: hypothetical protein VEM41_03930 [Actinomycetota bacterium]|nr:hypothetical protein [Actinomycetota bacterium]